MNTILRLFALGLITGSALILSTCDNDVLMAIGCASLVGVGIAGFAICVFAGQITRQDIDEADGFDYSDGDRN